MISDVVKYKSLMLLSSGPQRSTEVMRLVRSRDEDYKAEFKQWIEERSTVKYRIPDSGRAATMYCISDRGVVDLANIKKMFV